MFIHKIPGIIKSFYPELIWSLPTDEKIIYLTFDDGPIPGITEYILGELEHYQAKATFFCVGNNLVSYPDIAKSAIARGHLLANHTFEHKNGWKTGGEAYVGNVMQCEQALLTFGASANLFRPPYGRIKKNQIKRLNNQFQIVMWDVLTGDFSANVRKEDCLLNSIKATRNGSIVVFHDNAKAEINLRHVLPRYLDYFSKRGYAFKTLDL